MSIHFVFVSLDEVNTDHATRYAKRRKLLIRVYNFCPGGRRPPATSEPCVVDLDSLLDAEQRQVALALSPKTFVHSYDPDVRLAAKTQGLRAFGSLDRSLAAAVAATGKRYWLAAFIVWARRITSRFGLRPSTN